MKPRTNSSKTPRLKQIYTTVATWLIRGILSCALLVITLLAAVYLILDTQRGSDWLLSKVFSIFHRRRRSPRIAAPSPAASN